MLSPYAFACLQQIKHTDKHKSTKLVSTFLPRKNYVLHSACLSLYLELGLKLVKVHRVLSFQTSVFLAKYVTYCTTKRAESKSEFKKRLFKLFSNANFGKFIQQTRSYLSCVIVSNPADFQKYVTKPNFSNFKVLGGNFIACFMKPKSIYFNQSWGIGFTILERSKWLIFHNYYKIIKPALEGRVSVCFTDTDSLLLKIKTDLTMDEVMQKLSGIMDFSNYDSKHELFNADNRNKIKFWKDENKGNVVVAFCGICSKTYSMIVCKPDGTDLGHNSKCKGVGRCCKDNIMFEDFKKCIDYIDIHMVEQYRIQSKDHIIRTVKSNRLAYSSFDDKRFLICSVHSVPYGSKYIALCERLQRCVFCK